MNNIELIREIQRIDGMRGAIGGTPEIAEMYRNAILEFFYRNHEKLIAALTAAPQPAKGEELSPQYRHGFQAGMEFEAKNRLLPASQPAAAHGWPSSDPGYTTLFNAIAVATVNYAGFGVNVSVEKFREALAAAPQPQKRDTGIDAAVERGDLRNTFDPPAPQLVEVDRAMVERFANSFYRRGVTYDPARIATALADALRPQEKIT